MFRGTFTLVLLWAELSVWSNRGIIHQRFWCRSMRFALMCSLSSLIYWFEPFVSFSVWLILVVPWGLGEGWGGASEDSLTHRWSLKLFLEVLPQFLCFILSIISLPVMWRWWSLGSWVFWFRFDTKSGLTSHHNSHRILSKFFWCFPHWVLHHPLHGATQCTLPREQRVIILISDGNQWGPAAVARQ